MYRCLECGNEDKFYGMVKEQGNALIYQNIRDAGEPVPGRKLAAVAAGGSPFPGPDNEVRGKLWAIQDNGAGDELTWAYIASEGSWKGFHEVRSCAVCNSTNIASI
jgi:hypothetical protein